MDAFADVDKRLQRAQMDVVLGNISVQESGTNPDPLVVDWLKKAEARANAAAAEKAQLQAAFEALKAERAIKKDSSEGEAAIPDLIKKVKDLQDQLDNVKGECQS